MGHWLEHAGHPSTCLVGERRGDPGQLILEVGHPLEDVAVEFGINLDDEDEDPALTQEEREVLDVDPPGKAR